MFKEFSSRYLFYNFENGSNGRNYLYLGWHNSKSKGLLTWFKSICEKPFQQGERAQHGICHSVSLVHSFAKKMLWTFCEDIISLLFQSFFLYEEGEYFICYNATFLKPLKLRPIIQKYSMWNSQNRCNPHSFKTSFKRHFNPKSHIFLILKCLLQNILIISSRVPNLGLPQGS